MAVPTNDEKRRAGGAIRVPFVRRCHLEYDGGETDSAFIVNINVLGAYVAHEQMPPLGRGVACRFQVPGNETEVRIEGVVAWTCHTPDAEGMGIEFRCRDLGGTRRLKELVRRLERIERQFELSVAG